MAGVPLKLRVVLTVALLMSVSFFAFMSVGSHVASAASPLSYVTVTLTNSQITATPKNFSQLIKVDWSTYSSELNTNVSNVRFYNSTTFSSSTELTGWIETNNTTAATSSNVWVNLSGTIVPASGSVDIYMAFLAKTSSWSSHWGLAPQLDKTYGKHDNGASVFEFYDNFAGTALNSRWTVSGITYTVNNGFTATATGPEGFIISKALALNPATYVLDFYGTNFQTNAEWTVVGMVDGGESGGTTGSGSGSMIVAGYPTVSQTVGWQRNGSGIANTSVMQSVQAAAVWTVEPTSSSSTNFYINYGGLQTVSSDADTYPLYEGLVSAGGSDAAYTFTVPVTVTWYRVRAYPPNGSMPIQVDELSSTVNITEGLII